MSVTAEQRKEWAYGILDRFTREWELDALDQAFSALTATARDMAECDCRTKHSCCLDSDTDECTWVPCPDCEDYINGTTWAPGLFALAREVENRWEVLA